MSNKVKYINIPYHTYYYQYKRLPDHTYYFFNDIINIKDFSLDKMKIYLFTTLNMWQLKIQKKLK